MKRREKRRGEENKEENRKEGTEREEQGIEREGQRYEELEDKNLGCGRAIMRRVNQTQRRMPELRALSRSPFSAGDFTEAGKGADVHFV